MVISHGLKPSLNHRLVYLPSALWYAMVIYVFPVWNITLSRSLKKGTTIMDAKMLTRSFRRAHLDASGNHQNAV